jgi:predicted transcriptional regulator
MRTIEELRLLAVWVNPDHMVSTALHLMRGHRIATLGVVANGQFLGIVNQDRLLRAPENELVEKWIEEPKLVVEATIEAKRAAALFVQEDVIATAVIKDGKFDLEYAPRRIEPLLGPPHQPIVERPASRMGHRSTPRWQRNRHFVLGYR